MAYDNAVKEKRPGVLVIHDWTGLQDYTKRRSRQLAEMGYVAFAADVYGKGIRPTDPKECAATASVYKKDSVLFRKRVSVGLSELRKQPHVDSDNLAAIGYCFGGAAVLELARSGADINGAVSFHGSLASPMPAKPGDIKCKVLVCHGADDPFVKPEEVAAFKAEMEQVKAQSEFISYSGAVHSFTKLEAGTDNSKGNAYNENADKESWSAMRKLFIEVLGK